MELATIQRTVRDYCASGRYEEGEALVRPFLAGGTGLIDLWKLLVDCIRPQGKLEETLAIQEMMVSTIPGLLPLRFDLAETLLLLGHFERGWREYRYRYDLAHTTSIARKVQRERWNGSRIEGKTLLIHDEQGYGDTFQFLRMVKLARERSGARVILQINAESASLARRYVGYDTLVLRGEIPPAFDFHCEMMSLPMVMGLKLEEVHGQEPYLSADPSRVAKWEARLADLPRPLVALVWAGRPTHPNDANRSMHLKTLAPLANPGVTYLAIQKGPASDQANEPPPGMNVISLSDEIQDFEDTAAILQLADLLISVDSSPVHLAGAMGRPVWVMLPFVPDWRWMLQRTDTPWYGSMRLVRQNKRGDWDGVAHEVAAAVNELVPLQQVHA
ncbi:glycosyltransferase family 9 protein [Paraburkholderia youngii]|uniref:glycosyltransferase family 9 protein n=1 Tax=Paraburkholderia youngii TaxID=2782701 RepID=UPI003D206681